MMRFPRSIRWRLQLWYGALLFAVLAGFGATAFHLEKTRLLRRADTELQDRLAALVDALRASPDRGPERRDAPMPKFSATQSALFSASDGYYYSIWMRDPAPAITSPNAPANLPKPGKGETLPRTRGDFREMFLFAAPVDCVLVGRSIAADRSELRTFALVLSTVGGGVLALALLVGWRLASRAVRPVEAISTTAERIAGGDLAQRINTTETDSELGRLAGVLNATFARLEAAFSQQMRFTADAAHDLRTPVSIILTQTQSSLARERPAAEYREALEACQRAAQRMRSLTESLLQLARLDAGQEPLRRSACDLSAIAADCTALIQTLAEQRHITITTDLKPAPLNADAERIAQVVTNLLTNAIEYNHEGGSVRIATARTGNTVTLTVENTGPGISAADRPKVFERFHRADASRTGSHAGLGLSICKAIVTSHDGTISVEGRGEITALIVHLPVSPRHTEQPPA